MNKPARFTVSAWRGLKSIKRATRDLRRSVQFVPENFAPQTVENAFGRKTGAIFQLRTLELILRKG